MSEGSYLSQNDSKGLFDIGFADKLWAKYVDSHAYLWIIYGVWSASDVARIYLYMISAPYFFQADKCDILDDICVHIISYASIYVNHSIYIQSS